MWKFLPPIASATHTIFEFFNWEPEWFIRIQEDAEFIQLPGDTSDKSVRTSFKVNICLIMARVPCIIIAVDNDIGHHPWIVTNDATDDSRWIPKYVNKYHLCKRKET